MNIGKNAIYIPDPNNTESKNKSVMWANLMVAELANYGYSIENEAYDRLTRHKKKIAKRIVKEILKEYTVGELNRPLFPDWEKRTEFSFGEIVCQICGYIFQFSGNDLCDPEFMERLKSNVGYKKTKTIRLVLKDEFRDYFSKLINATTTLDRKTSKKLEGIFQIFSEEIGQLPRIKSAEIRIAALLVLTKEVGLSGALKGLKCEPVDALRYAAAKKDFESFKLPHDVLFDNLSWGERVDIFTFLNLFNFERLGESMGLNRGAWERFLRHTHFFGQKGFVTRFNHFYTAAFVSVGNRLERADSRLPIKQYIDNRLVEITPSGNLAYRTFASRIMSAIENKNWPQIKTLCENNKGYVFRNLMTVSNGVTKEFQGDFVAFLRDGFNDVSVSVLFSILSIDTEADYRIIDIKGNTVIEEANYPEFIKDIQGDIKRFINKKYGYKGKVEVAKSILNNAVPFLSNNAELPRGTRISIDKDYLYFFVHWIQNQRRTDLDHSFQCFDSNWHCETIYFGNQANDFIAQSGDLTNAPAPHGATEYGRIAINKIPASIRYIVPSINVFSGDVFSNLKEARAGFQLSNESQFSIKRNLTQYDLTQPAQFNIPFVYDVQKQEVVVLDFNNRVGYGIVADSYQNEVKKLIQATKCKNYMTISELADMLSGDAEEVSVKIGNKQGDLKPEELFSVFN